MSVVVVTICVSYGVCKSFFPKCFRSKKKLDELRVFHLILNDILSDFCKLPLSLKIKTFANKL